MDIGAICKRYRTDNVRIGRSQAALRLACTYEYIRRIEECGALPSDEFIDKLVETYGVPADTAHELRQAVVDQRVGRKRGTDLRGFRGAEQVAADVRDDLTPVLRGEIGVSQEDLTYFFDCLRRSIVARLR